MRLLKFQQNFHLTLLFLVIFLYLLSNKVTSQGADEIKQVRTIIEIAGFCWTAWLTVIAVRYGTGFDFPKRLFNAYRQSITRLSIVTILNIMLAIGVAYLIYLMAWFRDVEFISNREAELLLNDKPGEVVMVAKLEKDKQASVRLKQGIRLLVARSGDELIAVDELHIEPIWNKQKANKIQISFPEHIYGKIP